MEIKELQPQKTLSVRVTVKPGEIGMALDKILPEIMQYIGSHGVQVTGPPYTRYHSYSDTAVDMESGMPVADPGAGTDRVVAGELPGGRAVSTIHVGSYGKLHETYQALADWIREQSLEGAGAPWEVYLTDPRVTKEPEWKTEVINPVK